MFYVPSYARFNVFQAQHNAEEFEFTGSGVNCKLFTVFISLVECGGNSCVHLSQSLNWEETNGAGAAELAGQSLRAGHSFRNTLPGSPAQSLGQFHS